MINMALHICITCVCICVWRPENNIQCLFSFLKKSLYNLLLWDRVSHWARARCRLGGQRSELQIPDVSTPLPTGARFTAFYISARDPNTKSHAYVENFIHWATNPDSILHAVYLASSQYSIMKMSWLKLCSCPSTLLSLLHVYSP